MVYSRMWLNGTMQTILYDYSKDTFTVAVYLMTTPHAHMCGVYYLPFSEIGEHCNLSANELAACMTELQDIGFCQYDHKVKVVWVTNMWRYQIGDPINPKDHKVKGTLTHLQGLPTTYLVGEFLRHSGLESAQEKPLAKPLTQAAREGTVEAPRSLPIPSDPPDGLKAGGGER
jgi:hypothetical protein